MKNKNVKIMTGLVFLFAMAVTLLPAEMQAREDEPVEYDGEVHYDTLECYGYPTNCFVMPTIIIEG